MTQKFTHFQIEGIQSFVETHLHDRISLRELAEMLNLSPHRLQVLFQATFGTTPRQYILGRQVSRAIWKLLHTTDSISSIAMETGFSSHSHFTNRFRKTLGQSPQEFRAERADLHRRYIFSDADVRLEELVELTGHTLPSGLVADQAVKEKDTPSFMIGAEDIVRALEFSEFRMHYQLQVSTLPQRTIRGVEALVRWMHPVHGLIPPSLFIPKIESMGMMRGVSIWVLRNACRDIGALLREGADIPNVSVNISTSDVSDPAFLVAAQEVIEQTKFQPSALTLEITESQPLKFDDVTLHHIKMLRDTGIKLSIDDFGAGYTGFHLLRSNMFDEFKLDYFLVKEIATCPTARALVTSMVRLGKELGMTVVAEGVETSEQSSFLASLGDVVQQGYMFSYPQTLEKLTEWFRAQKTWTNAVRS